MSGRWGSPPAGKILLGIVLLLNRIYKSHAFLTFARRYVHAGIAYKNKCRMQHFMIFHKSASSTAVGPTMVPLERVLNQIAGSIIPAQRFAGISSMSGRRGCQTARLYFSKKYKKQ